MSLLRKIAPLLAFLFAALSPAFSQLRMHSPYDHDRISPEHTGFALHDGNTAEFVWASEWTEMTAQSCADEVAMFIWHFKDGTKAYSKQGDLVSDFGKNTQYLLTQKASTLEDANHNKIQPLTRTNYPIKVELWIGDAGGAAGFSAKSQVDCVCLDAADIEYDRFYRFSDCPDAR